MKYYDKGFIFYYENHTNLQLLNIGKVVLNLDIYPNKICQGTFECLNANEFNSKYLDSSYSDDFLYKLFKNSKINYKDRKNNILIKVK